MIPLTLRQVTNNLVDVFHGEGWENWSRWYINPSGYIKQVGGTEPEKPIRSTIINSLRKDKH